MTPYAANPPPMDKIELIQRSLSAFGFGLPGIVPFLGKGIPDYTAKFTGHKHLHFTFNPVFIYSPFAHRPQVGDV